MCVCACMRGRTHTHALKICFAGHSPNCKLCHYVLEAFVFQVHHRQRMVEPRESKTEPPSSHHLLTNSNCYFRTSFDYKVYSPHLKGRNIQEQRRLGENFTQQKTWYSHKNLLKAVANALSYNINYLTSIMLFLLERLMKIFVITNSSQWSS